MDTIITETKNPSILTLKPACANSTGFDTGTNHVQLNNIIKRQINDRSPITVLDIQSETAQARTSPEKAQALRVSNLAMMQGQPWHQDLANDPWPCFTLEDAFSERPPAEYLVGGIFKLPSLSLIYGSPGTLKSFLLADLAISVASGMPWLPPMPNTNQNYWNELQTKQVPVMWLDFDNGADRCHERFKALAQFRKLPNKTPFYYFAMPDPWLDLSDKEQVNQVANRILAKEVKLLVIDNLASILGGVDENSSAMAPLMDNLKLLREKTRGAILVIHHQRKGTVNGNSRAGDAIRGHSSIEAALDLALMVSRDEDSDTVSVKPTKTRGDSITSFNAEFTFEPGRTPDSLEWAIFYGMQKPNDKRNQIIEAILAVLREKDCLNQSNLIMHVKEKLTSIGKHKIEGVIGEMVIDKTIKKKPGEKNYVLYSLS